MVLGHERRGRGGGGRVESCRSLLGVFLRQLVGPLVAALALRLTRLARLTNSSSSVPSLPPSSLLLPSPLSPRSSLLLRDSYISIVISSLSQFVGFSIDFFSSSLSLSLSLSSRLSWSASLSCGISSPLCLFSCLCCVDYISYFLPVSLMSTRSLPAALSFLLLLPCPSSLSWKETLQKKIIYSSSISLERCVYSRKGEASSVEFICYQKE